VAVADEVGGDNIVLSVLDDVLVLALGSFLDGSLNGSI
jgi:hypothetical protein